MGCNMNKVFTFKCGCGDPTDDHVVKVWVDKEDMDVCLYASLNHYLPWYKRLLPAVKYLFGIDNTFIHYQETLMNLDSFVEQCNEIGSFIEEEEK